MRIELVVALTTARTREFWICCRH